MCQFQLIALWKFWSEDQSLKVRFFDSYRRGAPTFCLFAAWRRVGGSERLLTFESGDSTN
ncbi:hypothetical protein BY996DRAFT_6567365 [Phakopsora pachyrhizi]|nr:hypothetical protein BY996DRAFT_6567365 [Phakopsora pachyrhizi]